MITPVPSVNNDKLLAAAVDMPPILRSQDFYLAPQHDIKTPILALVNGAQREIVIEIYGYTWQPLHQALLAAKKRGIAVTVVFDHTQACGPAERGLVAELRAAGVLVYVGTSCEHQIRHSKFTIVDGEWVEAGSLNYSETAFHQDNTVMILRDRELAAFLLDDVRRGIAWLVQNEPQYQMAGASAA